MGSLCLFLFHTGGTDNTGPLYYFVFPIVAVFLQGIRFGSVSVIILLLLSIFIQESGIFGFDQGRYSFVFTSRLYTIYMILSILSFLFAWFREKVERELLLSQEDLESITHADLLTGLANRSFMEQLLDLEFSRFKRFGTPFSIILLKVDNFNHMRAQFGMAFANDILRQVARLLMDNFRTPDAICRWEDDQLMIMLSHTPEDSTGTIAARVQG